jgi:hypothetical protein
MPENSPENNPNSRKIPKPLLWLGALLGAVAIAWATDAFSLIVHPSYVLDIGKPPLLTTVLFNSGSTPDLAVASLPTTPQDRAVFLEGRFDKPEFLSLAAKLGGAWIDRVDMRVVFEAHRDSVRVMNVRVKDLFPERPIVRGAFIEYPRETAARNPQLTVDLESPRKFFARPQTPGRPFFGPESLPLKRGDQTELGLEIKAGTHSHTFALEVDYLVGGSRQVETFRVNDPAGRPFRVTGAPTAFTDYGTIYRNTGAGLHPVTGPAACVIFLESPLCASER